MAKQIQLRRGSTSDSTAFTGAIGEVTVDTDKDVLVVHDGATAGGFPVAARANADGTISLIKKDGTSAGSINSLGLFNNTLTSTNTNQAATAAQAKVLNDNFNSKSFGVGQSYLILTGSRVADTTYVNTTGKTIWVFAELTSTSTGVVSLKAYAMVNGNVVASDSSYSAANTYKLSLGFPVTAGSFYTVNIVSNVALTYWSELR